MATPRTETVAHLRRLYPQLASHELAALADRILVAVGLVDGESVATNAVADGRSPSLADPGEVVLITYGDTFRAPGKPHLQALGSFWRDHLAEVFSTMHVLPFFPSSSDGGFAVVDYRLVDPALGEWDDLRQAVGAAKLMVDLVCNHGSAQSEWFADFVADRAPGRDYFLTADPNDDLAMVTRPRTHPLLKQVETIVGTKHVWATFSHDQVDFDFANPDVLVEFCGVLGFYLSQGASRVRLDAIAYLWKRIGTKCVHLPETHRVIKLMRSLMQALDPHALLITETNVPHADNVSYFGAGDEAHVVYNFTLAPLIVWSVVVGQGETLTRWLQQLAPPPVGCTFLNFIASHDGIGLRPVEGLISTDDLKPMIDATKAVGGDFSAYSTPAGPRPYELNVSLADLLAGTEGETVARFVVAHAVLLAMQGIPAIYVHSMLASPGDHVVVAETNHNRDINRSHLLVDEAAARVSKGWRASVFASLCELISVRRSHPAFAPNSPQSAHAVHPNIVAIERGIGADRVLALHNMSDQPAQVDMPSGFGRLDLITGDSVGDNPIMGPWQALWLVAIGA